LTDSLQRHPLTKNEIVSFINRLGFVNAGNAFVKLAATRRRFQHPSQPGIILDRVFDLSDCRTSTCLVDMQGSAFASDGDLCATLPSLWKAT
jgi:hypothetical protein